ncbi:MAG: twin-arginine translocase subunit TatC [Saprospiraceae bacterium]
MSDNKDNDIQNEGKEMGFLDHLEELRWHVIRAAIGVIVFAIVALIFQTEVFEYIIFAPLKSSFVTYELLCNISDATCFRPPKIPIITRELGEQFFVGLTVSIYLGIIASFPYIFYEFWKFISPGLYESELKIANRLIGVTSMLFIIGVLFGYYIIAPFAITYLGSYSVGVEAVTSPTLSSYINYLVMFTIPTGIAFELPIIIYFLSKLGIVGAQSLRKYRKEAFLIIFIVAAIITPPDALTQTLIGLPVFALYELSILIAVRVERNQKAKEKSEVHA